MGSIGEEKSWAGENRVIYNIGYWKAPPIWEGFRRILRVPHVWHLLKVTENLDWGVGTVASMLAAGAEPGGPGFRLPTHMKSGHGGMRLES